MGIRLIGRRPRRTIDAGCATDQAGRPDNQDRCACSEKLAVLSDGMGGYAGGAVAAELSVTAVTHSLDGSRREGKAALLQAVSNANAAVREGRVSNPQYGQMGTTLTVALATGKGSWLVANVGDSPGWLVRPQGSERITEDHNVAAELLRRGAITHHDYLTHPGRSVLTMSIGAEEQAVPSLRTVTLAIGDRLILASDGLDTVVDTNNLHQLLGPVTEGSAAADAERLIDLALVGQPTDNVTVVVLRCIEFALKARRTSGSRADSRK